jgi:hypothetical protein
MTRILALYLLAATALEAQVERFPVRPSALTIIRPAQIGKPFTVTGEYGAILGEQSGAFEVWLWPVKILSHFGITAHLEDYPVPIELAEHAASIEVTPAMTTITYSHAAFTVKQRMFAPRGGPPGQGAVVLFEIASARKMQLTFHFTPEVMRMWPAPNFGPASAEWIKQGESGYYKLNTNDDALSAAVAIPRATPGILPPDQERPKTYPVELKLRFDPTTDSETWFPLLVAMAPAKQLSGLNEAIPKLYAQTADYYERFLNTHLAAETPDREFDKALQWAEVAIDQGQVKYHGETGLVAGFYGSGDSARPGYGWFFGRDALWTSYAINSYGDFALTRNALEFLIRRQRADGKTMHEFSQTAEMVDWKARSYFYAAADSAPLFVMAMEDYLDSSGDADFIKRHWDAIKRAYAFTRAHDSDRDGIYENTEGTGWVESWPPGMPHQEIYLAALDQQSAQSMSRLAKLMNDTGLEASASRQAELIRKQIEAEYYDPAKRFYAFSRNANGTLDQTATIYPAVAWWSGRYALAQPGPMLDRWASSEFSTDWGTRDVSVRTPFYDSISYHQGSVWPLFTGWVSLAEYRAGRTLSGYAHLMQNADLTWEQDLGSVTELLSGQFQQPLGRSSSHQTWSSAMVLAPALRGLFGIDPDARNRTLRIAPRLPAQWESARLKNVPLGDSKLDLTYTRQDGRLMVRARSQRPEVVCLVPGDAPREPCNSPAASERELALDLPAAEIGIPHGLPPPGSETAQLKVTSESSSSGQTIFTFTAQGGSLVELPLRLNRSGVRVSEGEITSGKLRVQFPEGAGYRSATVTFSW